MGDDSPRADAGAPDPERPDEESSPASTRVEGEGATVGEAKWAAMKELERGHPGLDVEQVEFEVLGGALRGRRVRTRLCGCGSERVAGGRAPLRLAS